MQQSSFVRPSGLPAAGDHVNEVPEACTWKMHRLRECVDLIEVLFHPKVEADGNTKHMEGADMRGSRAWLDFSALPEGNELPGLSGV